MPRYDYKCDTCRKKYELQQSFSAESSHACEKCGKGTATRLLSVPRIIFKGSGFYVNDKGGKNSKMSDKDVTGSDSKVDAKETADAKAESKGKSSKSKSASSSGSSSKSKSKAKSSGSSAS